MIWPETHRISIFVYFESFKMNQNRKPEEFSLNYLGTKTWNSNNFKISYFGEKSSGPKSACECVTWPRLGPRCPNFRSESILDLSKFWSWFGPTFPIFFCPCPSRFWTRTSGSWIPDRNHNVNVALWYYFVSDLEKKFLIWLIIWLE